MVRYSGSDFIAAVLKGILFGLGLGFVMAIFFESFFFFFLTIAFFFFIPMQDEEIEEGWNAMIFMGFMVIVLWLSALDAPLGLGYDVGGSFAASPILGTLLTLGFGLFFFGAIPNKLDKVFGAATSQIRLISWIGLAAMLGLIFFYLEPWTWTTTAIIFIGFWVIAALGGGGGDLSSRHVMGAIFVVMAIVVFSATAGTQVVGELAFGQWWPTMAQTGSEVFGPMGDMFGQIGTTFGSALQLVTNPTGFAQSIMNGTYQADPSTGLAGSYGVEIENFRTTPIYIGQPFSVMLSVKNKGSFEAEMVHMYFYISEKTPVKGILAKDVLDATDLGFETNETKGQLCQPAKTWWIGGDFPVTGCSKIPDVLKMTKLDTRQVFFDSNGLNCSTVEKYELISQYVPLVAIVDYDYKVDSSLNLEFYSEGEWTRLEREGKLVTQAKKPSTITSAPVRLNIDAPEQPVREGVPFFLAIELNTPKSDGKIKQGAIVELSIPTEMSNPTYCTKSYDLLKSDVTEGRLVWAFDQEPYVVLCQFAALTGMDDPSKTFVITANASYRYVVADTYISKLEFGGKVCCDEDSDCKQYNTTCNTTINECSAISVVQPKKGAANYCEWRKERFDASVNDPSQPLVLKGLWGEGNCTADNQCQTECRFNGDNDQADITAPLECRDDIHVCCPEDEPSESCLNKYNMWLAGNWDYNNMFTVDYEFGTACPGLSQLLSRAESSYSK